MNGTRDSYYMALGLRPGASPAEIKAAYRRLAKLYHPDQDRSLDAEVKYKEARAAYDALRSMHLSGETYQPPAYDGSGYYGYAEAGHTVWTAQDWATEYDVDFDELHGVGKAAERISFSLANLPAIFMASLKELANIGVVIQVIIAAYCVSASYMPMYDYDSYQSRYPGYRIDRERDIFQERPYKNLVRVIAIASGLAAVVLRYYVTLRQRGAMFIFAVFSYPAVVTVLVNYFYPGENLMRSGLYISFLFAFLILTLNPLGTLAELAGFFMRGLFKMKGRP